MDNDNHLADVDVEYTEEDISNAIIIPDEETETSIKPELRRLYSQHPECKLDYIEDVSTKLQMKNMPGVGSATHIHGEDGDPVDIDKNHRTYPFLTIYEKTRIIGLRANQLSRGATPFVAIPKHMTDVRDIARLEFDQKRIPVFVRRPIPNGSAEYWKLSSLMAL